MVYSSSGIPGVRRVRAGDTEEYEATWGTTTGKQARTKVAITKHGETKALQLAKQARSSSERLRRVTPAHEDEPARPRSHTSVPPDTSDRAPIALGSTELLRPHWHATARRARRPVQPLAASADPAPR